MSQSPTLEDVDDYDDLLDEGGHRWRNRLVGLALLAVLVAAGAYALWAMVLDGESSSGTEVQTATVAQGSITQTISTSGVVVAESTAELSFGTSGQVIAVNVTLGQEVQEGAVLAEIESDSLQDSLISAELNLASAQVRLNEILAGSSAAELISADQSLAPAQANLDQASRALQDLLDGPSESELLSAQQSVMSAESQLVQAMESKGNLFEAAEAAVAAAEEAVTRAQTTLESVQRSADNSAGSLISSQASLLSAETNYCDDFWPDSDAIAFCHERAAPMSAADETILLEDTTTENPQRASQAAQLLSTNVSYKNTLASRKAADEAVETAKADIKVAKQELEEAKNDPTAEEISRDDDAIASAAVSLDLATIRRAEVEDGATADELASAQHNVDNAAFSLDTAKLKRDESYAGATADEIEAQRGQVQLAELALARAQNGLEDALLIAPFDGTVAALNIEVGQATGPNQTTIILNTPDAVRFDITITESDRADVAVGQVGLAFLDALGDTPVPIVIDSIGTAPTTTQGVVTYRVEASIFSGTGAGAVGAPGGEGGFGGGRFGGGAGQGLFNVAGPSEEFADFLGISQLQLESELGSEGATPGSVAEAHGRSRDELSSFLIDQIETSLSEAVEAGTLPQGNVDTLIENLTSNVDTIIDGGALTPGRGGSGQAPVGGAAGDAEVRPLPGMNASITITIAQSVNVLTVPAQAIQNEGLQSFVEILREDGSTERVEVQAGLSDGTNTEITGELEAGAVIVFSGRAAATVQPTAAPAFPGGGGGGRFGGGGGAGGGGAGGGGAGGGGAGGGGGGP